MKKLNQLFDRITCLVMTLCLFIVIFAIRAGLEKLDRDIRDKAALK